jgi:hypothetical protein
MRSSANTELKCVQEEKAVSFLGTELCFTVVVLQLTG